MACTHSLIHDAIHHKKVASANDHMCNRSKVCLYQGALKMDRQLLCVAFLLILYLREKEQSLLHQEVVNSEIRLLRRCLALMIPLVPFEVRTE